MKSDTFSFSISVQGGENRIKEYLEVLSAHITHYHAAY